MLLKVTIYIDKVDTEEVYASVKVVRVYMNIVTTGGIRPRNTPDIDFTDYKTVQRFYPHHEQN
jgi:hypothetical protein